MGKHMKNKHCEVSKQCSNVNTQTHNHIVLLDTQRVNTLFVSLKLRKRSGGGRGSLAVYAIMF